MTSLQSIQNLKQDGRPWHANPRWLETTRQDSAAVTALRATLGPRDEPPIHGVAVFTSRRGPTLTLTRAGAERLADELDQVLAEFEAEAGES